MRLGNMFIAHADRLHICGLALPGLKSNSSSSIDIDLFEFTGTKPVFLTRHQSEVANCDRSVLEGKDRADCVLHARK